MWSISKGKAFLALKQAPCTFFQSSCNLAAAPAEGNVGRSWVPVECRGERLILIRAQVDTKIFSGGQKTLF